MLGCTDGEREAASSALDQLRHLLGDHDGDSMVGYSTNTGAFSGISRFHNDIILKRVSGINVVPPQLEVTFFFYR